MEYIPSLWNPNSVSSSGRLASLGAEITLISSMIRSARRLPVDWIKLSLTKSDSTSKRIRRRRSRRRTCVCKYILHNIHERQGWRNSVCTPWSWSTCRFAVNATARRAAKRKSKSRAAKSFVHALSWLRTGATMRRRLAEKRNFLINEAETRRAAPRRADRDSAFREQRNGRRKRGVLSSDSLSSLLHERAR